MMKNKKKKATQALEDQDLYEEIMSETKRLRALDNINEYLNSVRKKPAEQPAPEKPASPPAAPEIPQPSMPEVPQQPQRPSGNEISAQAPAKEKKKKGFSWFQKKKKAEEFDDWAPNIGEETDDIYYGLKLKPIEEYKKEYEASGRSQQASEPTSSFAYLFDRTQQLPDLSEKFEELHKERQERVAQAALEAGVETDDIFSLCKEKSDLDFNYDEWKRNTQSIPIIKEEDLAAAQAAQTSPQPEPVPPAAPAVQPAMAPAPAQPEPMTAQAPESAAPAAVSPQPPAPAPVQPEPAAQPQPVSPQADLPIDPATAVSTDTLQFKVLNRFPNGLNKPETRLPVEVNPSDSMEAKELEVEQLIQQALNQVKSTSSIFERVARSSQDDILDILEETSIGTPEPETISEIAQNIFENTQQEALADIRQAMETAQAKTAEKQTEADKLPATPQEPAQEEPRQQDAPAAAPEPAVPKEPLDRYRFHQRPVRIFKLSNVDKIVEEEIKNFTVPPAVSNPVPLPSPLPESQSAFSEPANATGPDTTEPMPETVPPASEGDQAQPPAAAAGEGSIRSMPKIIPLPLKRPEAAAPADSELPEEESSPPPESLRSRHRKHNKFELPPEDGEPVHKKKRFLLKGDDEEDNDPEDEFQPPPPELEDYNSPDDIGAISTELNASVRELTLRMLVSGLCAVISVGIGFVFEWFLWNQNLSLVYLILNLIFLLIPSAFCYMTIFHGIRSLVKLQASSDSSVAVALLAGIIHAVSLFFAQGDIMHGNIHLYSSIAIGALFLNTLGKFSMVHRIRKNFKFVTSSENRYNVEMYDDYNIAIQLAKNCIAETPHIAYQRQTRFLKGFLRNSYEPDPSENTSQIVAPIAFVASLVLCIVCSIITSNAISGLTAFAIATCICTPITNMLCVNLPIARLCRIARQNGAMMVGYKTIDAISDTNAVMVDSTDLFPKGSISLSGTKTFGEQRIDRAILDASALMSAVGGTLREVFENVIQERKGKLPPVENASYEDKAGIIGWVSGKRILLGNREMLHKYKVNPPELDFEKQYVSGSKQVIYLAVERQLMAMFILTYEPDRKMALEIQRLEENGIAMIVRTLDPNITPEFLAKRFDLDPRAIHILPERLGEHCDNALNEIVDEADVTLATRGKAYSMMRMLAACIRQKGNISIAVVLQTVSIILGFVLVAFFACCSAFGQLSTLSILIYELFWILTILLIPRIRKP